MEYVTTNTHTPDDPFCMCADCREIGLANFRAAVQERNAAIAARRPALIAAAEAAYEAKWHRRGEVCDKCGEVSDDIAAVGIRDESRVCRTCRNAAIESSYSDWAE
jgi:hypothetical protein